MVEIGNMLETHTVSSRQSYYFTCLALGAMVYLYFQCRNRNLHTENNLISLCWVCHAAHWIGNKTRTMRQISFYHMLFFMWDGSIPLNFWKLSVDYDLLYPSVKVATDSNNHVSSVSCSLVWTNASPAYTCRTSSLLSASSSTDTDLPLGC